MNEVRKSWRTRFGDGHGRGLFWGLFLVAFGGFWLLGNLDLVSEPAKIVLPSVVILWGLATLFTRRAKQ
jgi:hypothetical protein